MTGNYNVVFEYTAETGGYAGVITWTSFKNKEDFEKWYTSSIKKRQKVIDENVTTEKAVELCRKTPLECLVRATNQEIENRFMGHTN